MGILQDLANEKSEEIKRKVL